MRFSLLRSKANSATYFALKFKRKSKGAGLFF